jgi:hypothetical protein
LPLANTVGEKGSDRTRVLLHCRRPAVRPPFLARLGDTGFDAIPQDIALEFCKHG